MSSNNNPQEEKAPEDEIIACEPPKEWLELWFAARAMLQSYGLHRHEGRCASCNEAWDNLHAALLKASRPKVAS